MNNGLFLFLNSSYKQYDFLLNSVYILVIIIVVYYVYSNWI